MKEARGQSSGFTLIEVMVSLGIMTVGALGMLALQQHTIRSNSHAREMTTAMQIAQLWIERLKQDASMWTTPGATPAGPLDAVILSRTQYLKQVATNPNKFQTIQNTTDTVSNSFDFQGNDVAQNSAGVYYCASFRPMWVYYGNALRVDVRVWWPREASSKANAITVDFAACADDDTALNPSPVGAEFNNYHVVYLSTVIRVTTPVPH